MNNLINKYNFTIDKVVYHKKRLLVDLYLKLETILPLDTYTSLVYDIDNLFNSNNLKVNLFLSYSNLDFDSNIIINYCKYFIKSLSLNNSIYKSFLNSDITYSNSLISIFVFKDANLDDSILKPLNDLFLSVGIDLSIKFMYDDSKEIKSVIEEENKSYIEELNELNNDTKISLEKKKSVKSKNYKLTAIKDLPQEEHLVTKDSINIEGNVFDLEVKKFQHNSLLVLKVYDGTDSIVSKKWLSSNDDALNIKVNDRVSVFGYLSYDKFEKDVVLNVNKIELLENNFIVPKDSSDVKRVEFHIQSKMSVLDGLASPSEIIERAISYGHKGIAITDFNGVYNIPDIANSIKGKDFKPIYGIKMNYVDDTNYYITEGSSNASLNDLTYVVFDIETTGLRHLEDEIIEIAAIKIQNRMEVDRFSCFVKPTFPISDKISSLTHITNEMVKDALGIKDVVPSFLDFIKDSVLVAHNSSFDVGMLRSVLKRLDLKCPNFLVIDTLNVFRALHYDKLKRFNLKELAKFYKVKQEQHHRAIDDTRVTADCFVLMLDDLLKEGIKTFDKIKKLIKPDFYRTQIPSLINIIVKNQVGLKNLYKLISYASTTYCVKEPLLLRSVLEQYREGLLVGSGYFLSEVFEEAFLTERKNLSNLISFYDYIEINPISCFDHLIIDNHDGRNYIIDVLNSIIKTSLDQNKIVIATSDAYYLDKEDKGYRDILINSPLVGGGFHNLSRYDVYPCSHFRTTNEMLDEFSFLSNDLAYELVVTNTNKLFSLIEYVEAFPKEMFAPRDDEFKDTLGVLSIEEELKKIVEESLLKIYGPNPHPLVLKRMQRELDSIINNGYSSVYYISSLLVKSSLSDGYLVGSRGSVGSSLVATLMQITEINPLPPHYLCPKCHYQEFKMTKNEEEEFGVSKTYFKENLNKVLSGYDLELANCPICNTPLLREGHDIPFETFLGFDGDKVPDIDLNFSGDYQAKAHEFVRKIMACNHSFRSGTVGTLADRNAFGYVKAYLEKKDLKLRSCEVDRLSKKLVGIRRSTGQHPGGIIVVPRYKEIFDVTPYQYPADNTENDWYTTHFDYHSFENNLLKLDILGHDDPTIIKYLMDYVHLHQEEFPFSRPEDIPINDPNVYKLFNSTSIIDVDPSMIESEVASFAVPEFGTPFVRKLLIDTKPQTFADLVKISGLSHGTGVWVGNAQELVLGNLEFGKIPFSDVIGCRDDIMVYLMYQNLEPLKAFEIMEFVRKGKTKQNVSKWNEYKEYMRKHNVCEWYIWSCEQIEYMFPKAHATAYVLMALRIAWFKVYSKELFYSSWFSKRAKAHSASCFVGGTNSIKAKIEELSKKKGTKKDEDLINALWVALEASLRGVKFLQVDVMKSDVDTYLIEDKALRCPFMAIDGLGEAAARSIIDAREEKPFSSKEDFLKRTKVNKTIFDVLNNIGAFLDLKDKEDSDEDLLSGGIFGFAS